MADQTLFLQILTQNSYIAFHLEFWLADWLKSWILSLVANSSAELPTLAKTHLHSCWTRSKLVLKPWPFHLWSVVTSHRVLKLLICIHMRKATKIDSDRARPANDLRWRLHLLYCNSDCLLLLYFGNFVALVIKVSFCISLTIHSFHGH
jgi:hypothetical protein